ncbi:serine/threonine-protein kinase [Enhygromyxa salina]|uniref:serine/threonine-protein kinase n=1 Tax=Enhygromyxa salina TaxID=215803 RepID=UPI0011BABA33|nr:serine/threonine-protein kinase [Enhygromyxa salina]
MPDSERLRPGQLIADRYRVGEVVGRGAMGVVYVGEHVRVGRRVAIKVLTQSWSKNAAVRQRFEAEARAASAAGHPNVIQVFDVGELPDQRLYLVMEFVDGRSLYALLWAQSPIDPVRACRLIRDASFGVRAAHAQGVIHRDLKLENVMVQSLPEGESVKVLDFGIAAGVVEKRSTLAGMTLGTPEYMAPEQVDGAAPTVLFDIYALGVMLFELLTKRLPIEADNPLMLMALKGNEPARRVLELRPELPPALDQLIADCLEIDPSRRPPSVAVFVERLTRVLAELEAAPARAPSPIFVATPGAPPARPSRATRPYSEMPGVAAGAAVRVAGQPRSRALLLGSGLGVVLLVALGVGWAFLGPRSAGTKIVDAAPAAAPPPDDQPQPQPQSQPQPQPTGQPIGPEPAPDAPANDQASANDLAQPVAEPPKPAAADVQPPHETARCERERTRALDGRRAHDWEQVLQATRQRECWARDRDRKKLETQAHMELGHFEDCLRTGKHLNDTEVTKWLTLCSKRLAG